MEPTATEHTATQGTQLAAAAIAITTAGPNSQIAHSLFAASWEQLITLQFHLQVGDIIGLLGLLFALDAWFSRRRRK
ncbi:hypothetical protein MM188_003207 [Vibrio cholerae]|nr:hypothetical protein [Vibrio cholerae]